MSDFNDLLKALKKVKGKFILSCYEKDGMIFDKSWNKIYKNVYSSSKLHIENEKQTGRRECIVMNY